MNNLIRFAPSDAKRLQTEFDNLVGSFFPTIETSANPAVWTPHVDLAETDDSYLITVDVPGLAKEDIHVNLHDGTLSISGERSIERKQEGTDFVRIERKSGNFYRSFSLPKSVSKDKISASYADGVLTVAVPKAEDSKPQRIDIR